MMIIYGEKIVLDLGVSGGVVGRGEESDGSADDNITVTVPPAHALAPVPPGPGPGPGPGPRAPRPPHRRPPAAANFPGAHRQPRYGTPYKTIAWLLLLSLGLIS